MRRGALALLLMTIAGPGCAEEAEPEEPAVPQATEAAGTAPEASPPLRRARCPAELANCATASGRIIYVERVDPDGDGDAHFVLSSRDAVTGPGLSVIDVKKSLRPSPLPVVGDRLSAAGPVYRGSYGQKQIEAIELHVARER